MNFYCVSVYFYQWLFQFFIHLSMGEESFWSFSRQSYCRYLRESKNMQNIKSWLSALTILSILKYICTVLSELRIEITYKINSNCINAIFIYKSNIWFVSSVSSCAADRSLCKNIPKLVFSGGKKIHYSVIIDFLNFTIPHLLFR